MNKHLKRSIALILSVLMLTCSLPFVSFAADDAGITIKSNVTVQDGTEVEDGIEFTYYIEIGEESFNGTATGDDGKTYIVTDGYLTIPYDVSATLNDVSTGAHYSVKRMAYDNPKYALIDETEAQEGDFVAKEYFVSVDGAEKTQISEEEYNAATDGEDKTVTLYQDAEGTAYGQEQLSTISGYVSVKPDGNYSIEQQEFRYVTGTLKDYVVSYSIAKSYKKVAIANTFYADTTISIDGYELDDDVETTYSDDASHTTKATARTNLVNKVKTSMMRLAFRVLTENLKDKSGITSVMEYDVTTNIPDQSQWSDNSETLTYSVNVQGFTEVTEHTYAYTSEDISGGKVLEFGDTVLAPAPTGTFRVDFMLYDGVYPVAFEGATFEVCDILGSPLIEGQDYNLEIRDASQSIPLVGDIGFTNYVFSNLKAGSYTIRQTGGQDGYIVDKTAYPFTVAREDGAVTGDNFGKSSFGSYTALTNNTYSIAKLKVFKNNSISINFTKVDQNSEPVEGASFMLIERDAFVKFIRDIFNAGIRSVGDINISDLLSQIVGGDFSSLDAGTILGIIITVVGELGDKLDNITIPAILTSKSDEKGLVELNNSKNMLNTLGAITNSGITGAELAEVLQKYFGNVIPEQYLPMLDSLAKMTGMIHVTTGFKAGAYLMLESEAPYGYERSSLMYTFVLKNDGTATVSAGILFPVLADAINNQFGIDLRDILIDEEEFERIRDTLDGAFSTFDEYAGVVLDRAAEFLSEILGEDNSVTGSLEDIKQTLHQYYEESHDLADTIGSTIKDINSRITDDVTEDWNYINTRYFVDINVTVSDCLDREIDGAKYGIYDSKGNQVEWVGYNESVNVPFGDYTLNTEMPEGWQLVDPDAATTITVDDASGKYAFNMAYHKEVQDKAVEPTCTSTGKTAGSHCEFCNEVIVAQQEVSMKEHDFSGKGEVTLEPTRTTEGEMTYTCTTCGIAKKTEPIPALGVIITVVNSEFGSATINGVYASNKETIVPYGESYTLVATPASNAEFVGWMANGKMLTTEETYSTVAYADTTYIAVFVEDDTIAPFTVTFMDNYGNVIDIKSGDELAAMTEMPTAPPLAGHTFVGWSMTLEEVKELTTSTVVTAQYDTDLTKTYTVTATGCTIEVNGVVSDEVANNVSYNSRVTVTPKDESVTATSWTANGALAAFGTSYSFFCGSDIDLVYSEDEITPAPAIAAVKEEKTNTHVVAFLATRSVVNGYTLVQSGFVYGKAMAEDDLILDNVGTVQGTDGGTVKYISCRNIASDGQFELNYGVTAMNQNACARAYLIYQDNATGENNVIYSDIMTHEYN